MANQEHVERLKQGAAGWNSWRRENKSLPTDLSGANLNDIDLSGANLGSANLSGANLSFTNLSGANLCSANLNFTNLSGADLYRANMDSADLRSADLSEANLDSANLNDGNLNDTSLHSVYLARANLTGADLHSVDLSGSNLSFVALRNASLAGADLTNAELYETIFADVDLSGVIGLDMCIHRGPSSVDHRTLQKSGRLPLAFLRGVGLPDKLIDYLPSLLDHAIQYYSCFISCSSKDQDFADRIYADLQNNGVRCWLAPHDLPIGGKTWDEIDAAIRLRDKILLILSEHSIKSDWVEDEASKGFAEERRRGQTVLFPLRLDDAVMGTGEAWAVKLRDQRNIGDFRRWKDHDAYRASFDRVLRDLKRAAE